MNDFLKIAWRNLWRNKRRTLITISSVFFATLLALVMRSFQLGFYNYTINSVIEHFFGHIQIQQADYFRNPSIDNVFYYSPKIKKILSTDPEIKFFIPRLQNGVMVAHGNLTKMGIVYGINTEKEKDFSGINKKLAHYHIDSSIVAKMNFLPPELRKQISRLYGYYASQEKMKTAFLYVSQDFEKFMDKIYQASRISGHYINPQDNAILIAGGLADYLGVSVGDSVILLGQGYHGSTAIGKYRIAGILALPSPLLNNTSIYMPLSLAQKLFSTYDILPNGDTASYVSYIAINSKYQASIRPIDYVPIEKLKQKLIKEINDPDIRVLGWKDLNKSLYQQIQSDNISGQFILLIIYIVIAFGVFGTVLMMTAERRKEFGIMLAVGMSRKKLKRIVTYEILLMSLIGILAGIIVAFPIAVYFHYHPIYLGNEMAKVYEQFNFEPYMPTKLPGTYFIIQPLVIVIMMSITSIYPLIYLSKLKIAKALRA